jgi:hypothetical protein
MVHAGSAAGPPRLFSWTVVVQAGDPPALGALGVSDDRDRALSDLSGALKEAPAGSHGLLHEVTVSLARVGYWYDLEALRAEVDQDSGEVILESARSSRRWLGAAELPVR